MEKKRLAREWLYLLGFLTFGLILVPLLMFVMQLLLSFFLGQSIAPDSAQVIVTAAGSWGESLGHMYLTFWSSGIGWVLMVSPYLGFQLVRSVLWAKGTLSADAAIGN